MCVCSRSTTPAPPETNVGNVLSVPNSASAVTVQILVDSLFYRRWIFTPLQFVSFNVAENVSAAFSVSPWHWYFTLGIPLNLSLFFPFFVHGAFLCIRNGEGRSSGCRAVLWSMACTAGVFSLVAHKE